ncbi:DUF4386 family protein [Caldithrix abyssi]|nr:DUF4386 family protein [Caldithrix abyssi]
MKAIVLTKYGPPDVLHLKDVEKTMTTKDKMNSIKKTARVAGFLYLIMELPAIFTMLYVPSILIVPGDAATTANNIMASEGLFRSSIVIQLFSQTIFIFLVLVLYKLLKPVNKNHAKISPKTVRPMMLFLMR